MKTASLCAKSFVSLLLGAVFMVVPFVASAAVVYSQPVSGATASATVSTNLASTGARSAAFVATASNVIAGGTLDYYFTAPAGLSYAAYIYNETDAVQIAGGAVHVGTSVMQHVTDTALTGTNQSGMLIIGKTYKVIITATPSGTYTGIWQTDGTNMQTTLIDVNGGAVPIDWNALYFPVVYSSSTAAIATSSGLWNSLTLASSTAQCNSGNLFTDGICAAGTFLFIPNVDILNAFFNIPTTAATKFPFSWIYGVKTEFNSLSVSSTTAMSTLSYNFHDLGIGSTTPMGNILPNVEVFSKNTIETYISPSLWATFQTLIATALWLSFFWFEFNRARRMSRPTTS